MPIRYIAVGFLLCIAIFAGTASRAAECDCTNLSVLQAELRNALRLQAAFRGQIATLRGMGEEQAVIIAVQPLMDASVLALANDGQVLEGRPSP